MDNAATTNTATTEVRAAAQTAAAKTEFVTLKETWRKVMHAYQPVSIIGKGVTGEVIQAKCIKT